MVDFVDVEATFFAIKYWVTNKALGIYLLSSLQTLFDR